MGDASRVSFCSVKRHFSAPPTSCFASYLHANLRMLVYVEETLLLLTWWFEEYLRMVHRQRVFIHVLLLSQEWSADRECLYMYRCFHKTFVI